MLAVELPLVAPLHRFTLADLQQVGGKAANLGELIHAGFPVPAGFVVTTAAYQQFVTSNGLYETIALAIHEQPASGSQIREAFIATPIPPFIEQQVLAAYQQFEQGPVAVRSSATAEDLPGASFAGQQDTYLNILGTHDLLDAVRRCWASLWTDRAIAYRTSQGIDHLTVKLAVVVQRMVPAEFAGVMFTANTVSGARNEMVIDASPGLGEAVVSGLVTPDHYVLRHRWWGWQTAERRAGQREVVIRPLPGGGTEHIVRTSPASSQEIPESTLRRLVQLGVSIQRHFGSPQDIEWAWAGGKLYILQARPITALPDPLPRTNIVQQMVVSNFAEMMPVRPYPLDLDTWILALGSAVEPLFALLGLDWSLGELFEEDDGVVARYLGRLPHPTWRTLLAPLRLVARILRYNPLFWQADPLQDQMITRARQLESLELAHLSWQDLLETLHAAREISLLAAGEIRTRYFPRAAFSAVRLRLFLALLGHTNKLGLFLTSAENKTVQMNRALEDLAGIVRSDLALAQTFSSYPPEALRTELEKLPQGRSFIIKMDAFMQRYGHRETVISSSLLPSWKDAPEVALGVIKGFATHPLPPSAVPAWQAARAEVMQHPLLRFHPLRSAFTEILEEARTLIQIREDTHFNATLSLPVFRRTLLEMGQRLVAAGILAGPEDIYHLRLPDLKLVTDPQNVPADLAAQLRSAALRRQKARARLDGTPLVDQRLFPTRIQEGDVLLSGMPGSPGVAEGPVRIIRHISEFGKLLPGEVLVAPYTNPAWTPLFQRAAAVVVDSGSPASHAAIVAREYGIPAVMATQTGTQTLQDGDLIRVDGSRGVVVRISP